VAQANINLIVLSGNLTKDPELRYLASGDAVTTLRLANNRRYRSGEEWQEETTFIDVVVWGKQAESCGEYLSKGSPVLVEGNLRIREWETKEGSKRITPEIRARRVHFLGSRGDAGGDTRYVSEE